MLAFLIKREKFFITSPSKEIIDPTTRFLFRLTLLSLTFPSAGLQSQERTPKLIHFVFDTHYHADYSFGNVLYTQTRNPQEALQHAPQIDGCFGFASRAFCPG